MKSLAHELVSLGLSDKEAAVYLALLEISPASVQDVATKANVNRATTYLLADSLAERGLVRTVQQGSKQLLAAEPPERLVALLRMRRKELELKEQELVGALPAFNAIYNERKEKPDIRLFEGAEGLREVRRILLEAEGEYVQIVPHEEAKSTELVTEAQPEHFEKLAAARAPMRGLYVMRDPDASELPPVPNGEIRLLSLAEFPVRAELTVRGDNVLLFSYRPAPLSLLINSSMFADVARSLFDLAWRSAEPPAAKDRKPLA